MEGKVQRNMAGGGSRNRKGPVWLERMTGTRRGEGGEGGSSLGGVEFALSAVRSAGLSRAGKRRRSGSRVGAGGAWLSRMLSRERRQGQAELTTSVI